MKFHRIDGAAGCLFVRPPQFVLRDALWMPPEKDKLSPSFLPPSHTALAAPQALPAGSQVQNKTKIKKKKEKGKGVQEVASRGRRGKQ